MLDLKAQTAILKHKVADLLKEAQAWGATAAEAAVTQNAGLSVEVRMGQVETVEHTQDQGLGVTVYFGNHKGSASTTDFSTAAIRDTVAAACKIARYTQEDPYAGLAEAEFMAQNPPDLDLYHPWDLEVNTAIELAKNCEATALNYDRRIVNSEGAAINAHEGTYIYGNSHGFIGGYPSSQHGLSCTVLGQDAHGMQRDHWWTSARASQDLETPKMVGQLAAQRTLSRLGARKLKTCTAPVIFQADVAISLLHNLLRAINGHTLYRHASFLQDHLGQQIFPAFVHIFENPYILKGPGSAPFDHEGVATKAKDLVTEGILQSYVLDSYSARKLGMQTTGNAGGVRNLRIDSTLIQDELRQALGTGLWVTELIGQGANIVTGDYSRGATGFWIENGEIAYPVEEITIASNLRDMFLGLQAIGNDVDTRGNICTGSWLLSPMCIAGE
ncbi:peptidase PmbA [Achromatium sp. WMS3]|nr:peptidase PmbA [Achromatium sp. WMS3]